MISADRRWQTGSCYFLCQSFL